MIAKLTGRLDFVGRDHVVIDVGGVGYLVRCPARTLAALPPAGETVSVSVETLVREDAIDLYGFVDPAERDWFRLLMTVQGVGAKVALSLLSALNPADLAAAIAAEDKTMLTRADGVGPKLATRLAMELKDKVGTMTLGRALASAPATAAAAIGGDAAAADAVSALVNLGYRRPEAAGAVERAMKKLGKGARVETLIPAGLKELGT
ncbi:MAG TPA: Holliday junction branch migration protein RuvA [Alphaproteobacteria bacterium]|nr:Holliday junction branch migration protein RuvA [Alphaproteobacteria bacterium]